MDRPLYRVVLAYFKKSGKYYSHGEMFTTREHLWDMWVDVRMMQEAGRLPDLVNGARMPLILVEVPDHPYNHPHLIVDPLMRST